MLSIILALFFFMGVRGIVKARILGYTALKAFAQVTTNNTMSEFMTYETEHFILKYDSSEENIIRRVGLLFENSYKSLIEDYEYSSTKKQLVFVYKDLDTLWKYQKIVDGQSVIGLYNMGIIHILSPNVYKHRNQDYLDFFEKNGPVLHEYTHKIIDDLSGGNIELWLTEGLALYEEYKRMGVEWAKDFEYKEYYSSNKLRRNFMELDETQAYKQSFDIVKALIDTKGRENILQVFYLLKLGYTMDMAFEKVYELSATETLDIIISDL